MAVSQLLARFGELSSFGAPEEVPTPPTTPSCRRRRPAPPRRRWNCEGSRQPGAAPSVAACPQGEAMHFRGRLARACAHRLELERRVGRGLELPERPSTAPADKGWRATSKRHVHLEHAGAHGRRRDALEEIRGCEDCGVR